MHRPLGRRTSPTNRAWTTSAPQPAFDHLPHATGGEGAIHGISYTASSPDRPCTARRCAIGASPLALSSDDVSGLSTTEPEAKIARESASPCTREAMFT